MVAGRPNLVYRGWLPKEQSRVLFSSRRNSAKIGAAPPGIQACSGPAMLRGEFMHTRLASLALAASLLLAHGGHAAPTSPAQPGDPSGDRQRMLQLLVASDVPPASQVQAGAEMRANAEAAGDDARQSLAFSVQCRGLLLQGLLADAAKACADARARAGSDDLAVFAAERTNGVLMLERGEPLAALPTLLEASAAATRSGDQLAIAASLTSLGSAAQLAGVNADAVDYYDRALAISTRIGADDLSSRIANNLGVLLLDSGDSEGARVQFQTAIETASRLRSDFSPVSARYGLALAEIQSGRPGDAIDRLRAMLPAKNPRTTPAQHADGMLFLARAELRLGNLAAAESAARAAWEQLRNLSPTRSYPAAAVLADVLVAAGKLPSAGEVLEEVLPEVPEDARGRIELLEAQERLLAAQGRYRDAYLVATEVRQARARQSSAAAARALAFLRVRAETQQRLQELTDLRAERARIEAESAQARVVRNFTLVLLVLTVAGAIALWGLMRARRRLETEVERRRSHESLAQLTGGVAHDFNNLMTIVQQTMGLLRSDASITGSQQALRLIDEAEDAARLGGQITWQLLTFAKQNPLHPEVIALPGYFAARRLLFERAVGQAIQLQTELTVSADSCTVRVDPTQLTTCLINLLTNARDAMSGVGEVRISATSAVNGVRDRRWPELPPGRYVTISVLDTGCGMSADVARQATTPFFTTKGVAGGTGLGLSAAQGFAAQSGGMLQIDSAPGQGTKVMLVLPASWQIAPTA
jgi:signal transduction histidine kinase